MEGPRAARTSGNGKSMSESSTLASSANVPAGEPCRNWPKGTRTAPERSCSTAVLAGSENVPPGRDITSGATLSGRSARISSNGSRSVPPMASGAGATTEEGGAAAAGVRAGGGGDGGEAAGTASGTAGGTLAGFENRPFKKPNMN